MSTNHSNNNSTWLTEFVNLCAGGKEVKRKGGEIKRERRGKHDQDKEIEGREQREEEREKKAETRWFQQGGMVEKRVSP